MFLLCFCFKEPGHFGVLLQKKPPLHRRKCLLHRVQKLSQNGEINDWRYCCTPFPGDFGECLRLLECSTALRETWILILAHCHPHVISHLHPQVIPHNKLHSCSCSILAWPPKNVKEVLSWECASYYKMTMQQHREVGMILSNKLFLVRG